MKWNKRHIFLAILLPIQMLLMQIISNNPAIIERYYSNGIYPYISSFFRILLGWIPFSVGDLLIAFALFIFVRFIFILIKSKFRNFIPKIVHFLAVLSVIYFCFYLFWGLNYYREPLAKNLNYQQQKYTTDQLTKVTKHIIEKLNYYQLKITKSDTLKVVNPYQQKEMYKIAISGYDNLAKDFPQLKYQFSSVKSSSMSLLQTYNGTSGYLNPLTGEAQINDKIPKTSYPTTTCHEMAHQIGFAAENEANFVGFLAANYNDDIYFKYASYRMAFGYCISEIRKRDSNLSKELWLTVNKGIAKDFNNSYLFWQAYKNPFEPLVKKGYNAYLKANKQTKGVASYNYVVDLLISYFEVSNKF
ncbi:DUF3810 domain-containing protein [Polaribacter vadi]|uniref:DUF3810 domain-containing protein n=1 Tax=Polaribacter TaxID=52959 RepID=UPI001C09656C|nr:MULTISPECIES: DUF3810 domain-containing protein [Polaribacter]MBU3012528.1 DUF3810 domain-containing protein [Polaribacter vadi]MDO6742345.1 DUF3810 domain-containing protein [Polaribacter sp. 1_MG-2023]